MNKPINQNAKQALNMLKMEIANEQGFNYNEVSDKIESNAPQNTLEGISKNVLAGELVGGAMTKSLVTKGEEILLKMYKEK
ncbi:MULTISPECIES: small, acid-soluble spore protein, alpha/beta type [Romboutsia]|uniref:small, acid-soluble spore protein, alpha/beta type n=1 Tax=Romboutsia TaxID=1501226 RepID=UPI001F06E257|nr:MULTISPECIES: small, acid-soluble spore protein, alpha/beta type [Romboutsia]MCH1960867.1 alpha/beta-type small acid-soluble spore protein [Romboutsia hominis]MCH1968699.1 alpha/beta-type small acid-soluble spore protein [Romboutsia hominis]MDB8789650.1 small, acid-soluble spore protein, alpha/beta type [Romboutsia sp. 1001216sp1]MDB8793013.1 small, acid-soluble spore protein, alpha/beta type [Romboutsia sp. 1001216sp1]MDB8795184.1 small, acid-soluble spore protein, alpha/beta type [Rombout